MPRNDYSRAERLSDAAVHLGGLVLAVGAVPVLIVVTVLLRPEVTAVAGVTIYGVALLGMIGASAAYNLSVREAWRRVLQRVDHAAIYLKIAGTYTPFALVTGQGIALTLGIWGGALAGVALRVLAPGRWRGLAVGLCLALGWAGVLGGGAMLAALPGPVIGLMIGGGLLYTAGVAFYLWDRLPFHYTIWHVFVLVASGLFYGAVLALVLMA